MTAMFDLTGRDVRMMFVGAGLLCVLSTLLIAAGMAATIIADHRGDRRADRAAAAAAAAHELHIRAQVCRLIDETTDALREAAEQ